MKYNSPFQERMLYEAFRADHSPDTLSSWIDYEYRPKDLSEQELFVLFHLDQASFALGDPAMVDHFENLNSNLVQAVACQVGNLIQLFNDEQRQYWNDNTSKWINSLHKYFNDLIGQIQEVGLSEIRADELLLTKYFSELHEIIGAHALEMSARIINKDGVSIISYHDLIKDMVNLRNNKMVVCGNRSGNRSTNGIEDNHSTEKYRSSASFSPVIRTNYRDTTWSGDSFVNQWIQEEILYMAEMNDQTRGFKGCCLGFILSHYRELMLQHAANPKCAELPEWQSDYENTSMALDAQLALSTYRNNCIFSVTWEVAGDMIQQYSTSDRLTNVINHCGSDYNLIAQHFVKDVIPLLNPVPNIKGDVQIGEEALSEFQSTIHSKWLE